MWQKANPMLHKPLTSYAKTLLSTIREEYNDLPFNRSNRPEFMTKRMNSPEVDAEKWLQLGKILSLQEIKNT